MKMICVYCGANPGGKPAYTAAAKLLAAELLKRGFGLVYGGGSDGIMGVIANEMLAGGGDVIGVRPKALLADEISHHGLTALHVVEDMHERKALMAELSDGFIALPGGVGTLDELVEIFTWAKLGFHNKPCGLLNVEGYYDLLLAFFEQMVTDQFLTANDRNLLLNADSAKNLLDQM